MRGTKAKLFRYIAEKYTVGMPARDYEYHPTRKGNVYDMGFGQSYQAHPPIVLVRKCTRFLYKRIKGDFMASRKAS